MLSHIELNVSDLEASTRFYESVLQPLSFEKVDAADGEYTRFSNGQDAVIVLCPVTDLHRESRYHRKGIGLSHFAIGVDSREDVDRMAAHLAARGVALLGDGKVETGYRRGYYTLAFEDPDRIMIEIVFHDPHYFSLSPP